MVVAKFLCFDVVIFHFFFSAVRLCVHAHLLRSHRIGSEVNVCTVFEKNIPKLLKKKAHAQWNDVVVRQSMDSVQQHYLVCACVCVCFFLNTVIHTLSYKKIRNSRPR